MQQEEKLKTVGNATGEESGKNSKTKQKEIFFKHK